MDYNSLKKCCILCFTLDKSLINIFDSYGQSLKIAEIISHHFWFQVNQIDEYGKLICSDCWDKTNAFHTFYQIIENTHKHYLEKLNVKFEDGLINPIEIKKNFSDFFPTSLIVTDPPNVFYEQSDKCSFEDETRKNNSPPSEQGEQVACEVISFAAEDSAHDSDDSTDSSKKDSGTIDLSLVDIPQYFDMNCDLCDIKFDSLINAKQHYSKKHKIAKGYVKCCNKRFSQPSHVLDHVRWHTNPNTFKCEVCERTFGEKRRLTAHMLRHEPDESKAYSCEKCSKRFSKKFMLNKHITAVHIKENQEFFCDICKKNFKLECTLRAHILNVHERIYQQICDICAKTFKTKQGFRDHLLTHADTEDTRVQCDFCGAWLKNNISLKTHKQKHNAVPQKCKFCNKIKPNRSALASHVLVVHSKPIHRCNICDKSFKKPLALTEHIASHTGENLYKCMYCPKMFKSNSNMYKHKKQSHPEEWSQDKVRRTMIH